GGSEQLLEGRLLVGSVAPALRLDADLAAQRERVDGLAGGRLDTEAEDERRRRRVPLHAHAEDREAELAHGDRSSGTSRVFRRNRAKKASISCHASAPPSKPRQRCRTTPVSS